MNAEWTLIRNPKAASGKGARLWPKIEAELQRQGVKFLDFQTTHPGHAMELAADLYAQGRRHFIAVGGDGTVNEIANGLLRASGGQAQDCLLSQIPLGTGNDWRKTMGIPGKWQAAIAHLATGQEVLQDVGVVHWQEAGQDQQRFFLNIAGMGYDAFVGIVANERKAQGKGGLMGYVSALISCLMRFEALPVTIEIDGKPLPDRLVFSLCVGVCQYNGGGMKQCPEAIFDDGLLDLTLINKLSKLKVLRNVPRLFSGSFVKNKEVELHRGRDIRLTTVQENLLEVDGENIGAGSAQFSIRPAAIRVLAQNPKR